jgi:hypothetical protein
MRMGREWEDYTKGMSENGRKIGIEQNNWWRMEREIGGD